MKPFPLVPWLDKNNIRPYKFAEMAGLAKRTIYGYVNGEKAGGDTTVLLAIEAATGGEVSLREMAQWLELKRAEIVQKEAAE